MTAHDIPGYTGIFRTDAEACAVYSEAAGIARMMPRGAAVPDTADSVVALVRWAHDTHTPLIPRGSGSSMAGGAIGDGIIVDLSNLKTIEPVDVTAKRIRAGAGALRDDIDAAARAAGLRFPPDPSSGPFCTIGGMIATNAAGAHTLKFGPARAWVAAVDCVFDDGSRATIERGKPIPAGIPALDRLQQVAGELRERGRSAATTRPGVRKDASGYAVHTFAHTGEIIDLLIGSEGTLAMILGADLLLTTLPASTRSVFGAFASLDDAAAAANAAREAGAAACELLDRTFLDIAAQHASLPNVPADTQAVLLAEAEGDSETGATELATHIQEQFVTAGATHVVLALTPVDERAVWDLRHAASPALAALDPNLRSLQFMEDGAVPPERLAEYIRGIRTILGNLGVQGAIFGHAGDGHLHVNPLIHIRQLGWRGNITHLLTDAVNLTAKLGGTLSGEHGDGRLRAPLMARVWPAEAIALFKLVKETFDPIGIFNPGVKVPLPSQRPIVDIKYDPALPAHPPAADAALARVARERCYHINRLALLAETADATSQPAAR